MHYLRSMRLNRPIIGFIIGLIVPVIGFIIVFALRRHGLTFDQFMYGLTSNHNDAALNFTLSILANGLVFGYFSNRRLDYTARGIFIATMLYVVAILWVKF